MAETQFVLKRKTVGNNSNIETTIFVLVKKMAVSGDASSGSWDDGSHSGRDDDGRGSDSYTIKKYVLKRKTNTNTHHDDGGFGDQGSGYDDGFDDIPNIDGG